MHNCANPHIHFFYQPHSPRDFTWAINTDKSYTYFTKDIPQLDLQKM